MAAPGRQHRDEFRIGIAAILTGATDAADLDADAVGRRHIERPRTLDGDVAGCGAATAIGAVDDAGAGLRRLRTLTEQRDAGLGSRRDIAAGAIDIHLVDRRLGLGDRLRAGAIHRISHGGITQRQRLVDLGEAGKQEGRHR